MCHVTKENWVCVCLCVGRVSESGDPDVQLMVVLAVDDPACVYVCVRK